VAILQNRKGREHVEQVGGLGAPKWRPVLQWTGPTCKGSAGVAVTRIQEFGKHSRTRDASLVLMNKRHDEAAMLQRQGKRQPAAAAAAASAHEKRGRGPCICAWLCANRMQGHQKPTQQVSKLPPNSAAGREARKVDGEAVRVGGRRRQLPASRRGTPALQQRGPQPAPAAASVHLRVKLETQEPAAALCCCRASRGPHRGCWSAGTAIVLKSRNGIAR